MKRFFAFWLPLFAVVALASCDPTEDEGSASGNSVVMLKSVTCEEFDYSTEFSYNSSGKLSKLVERYEVGDPGEQFVITYTYTIVYTNELIFAKEVQAEDDEVYSERTREFTFNDIGLVSNCVLKYDSAFDESSPAVQYESEYLYSNMYLSKIDYGNGVEEYFQWNSSGNLVKRNSQHEADLDYAHFGYGPLRNDLYSLDMNSVVMMIMSGFRIEQLIGIAGVSSANLMESVILGGENYVDALELTYSTFENGVVEKVVISGSDVSAELTFSYY